MPIPGNYKNIKELKQFLISQKKKKIKYTSAEILTAKNKFKSK